MIMPSRTMSGRASLRPMVMRKPSPTSAASNSAATKQVQQHGQGDLQGPEDHGQGRGDADLFEDLPVRGPVGPGHLNQRGIRHADPLVGIDHAGHNAANPDDKDLAADADAEPENDQRDPGDGRDGADHFKNGPAQPFDDDEPAHGQTQRYPHKQGQQIAGKGLLDAGPDMLGEQGAIGIHFRPFHQEELKDSEWERPASWKEQFPSPRPSARSRRKG